MAIGPSNQNPQYAAYKMVQELVDRFNSGELDYLPTKDKEQIAMQAAQFGIDNFKVENKPVKKALFDLTDTALLGLLPNEWRPSSIGEEYFGESGLDNVAGTVGTIAGMTIPIAGAFRAGKYLSGKGRSLWERFRGRGNSIVDDVSGGWPSGNKMALLNRGRDNILIGSSTRSLPGMPPQISGPAGLLPRVGRVATTPGMSQTIDIMNRGGGIAF